MEAAAELPDDERLVLGAMLISNRALELVVSSAVPLRQEHFLRDAHKVIFEAMLVLYGEGVPVDVLTVREALAEAGRLAEVGGGTTSAAYPRDCPT